MAAGLQTPAQKAASQPQDKQARLLSEPNPGHFSLVRAYHLADVITLGNGFCGVNSILFSLRYCLGPKENFTPLYLAYILLPLGLFFDFFDGKVARWRGKSSVMGQELDSLADLISFGVGPAVAAFASGFRTGLDQIVLTLFVLAGLARLARFNVSTGSIPKDATGKALYFEGLPIPTSLLVQGSLLTFWLYQGWVLDDIPGGIAFEGTIFEVHPAVGIWFLHGCAMISRTLHVPKP
ncbi:hypothetical protein AMS68_005893 [Peltaster fructicola]|uniref:CDP-diacylglycerol--serine O-phosphatidyltransferase n=1 Tax=Peltaster fructicola TaxID=286661 RepID=A0A6H0Y0B4_9PEZI|nr:hypothetical protein AMS68_005893 [Peltaster fructicola]